jgi:hypothetical protein
MEMLKELSHKVYKEQAVWFMNAYWARGPCLGKDEETAESIWKVFKKCVDLDPRGEGGNDLNEFDAHRLLEHFDSTLTVRKMREALKDIDLDFDGKVSLTEYLVFRHKVDWKVLVNAPQAGADSAAVERATEKVNAARAAAAEAVTKEEESKVAEKAASKAKAEADAALAELQAQEDALTTKKEKLEATGDNMEFGIVKRNKAKAELAQLNAEDPLPLRQAKITQEACVRRLRRALKAASAAAAAMAAARKIAEAAFEEALQVLEEVKASCSAGQGSLWWLDRELIEAMQYMPQKKQEQMAKRLAESKAQREAQAC